MEGTVTRACLLGTHRLLDTGYWSPVEAYCPLKNVIFYQNPQNDVKIVVTKYTVLSTVPVSALTGPWIPYRNPPNDVTMTETMWKSCDRRKIRRSDRQKWLTRNLIKQKIESMIAMGFWNQQNMNTTHCNPKRYHTLVTRTKQEIVQAFPHFPFYSQQRR